MAVAVLNWCHQQKQVGNPFSYYYLIWMVNRFEQCYLIPTTFFYPLEIAPTNSHRNAFSRVLLRYVSSQHINIHHPSKSSRKKEDRNCSFLYCLDFASLVAAISSQLREVTHLLTRNTTDQLYFPKVLIIGALGRCGQGATAFAKQLGYTEGLNLTLWDINETKVLFSSL